VDAPKLNRSLWLETAEPRYSRLAANIDVDVAIVGAGITGVTAAALLKAAGAATTAC
jgi:ribulose 1,5-bisphosphate synthetase/thiazole synthase